MDGPLARWRTVFVGDKALYKWQSDSNAHRTRPADKNDLKVAPVGLGYLVANGYMGDARALYCASAGGNMPNPWTYGTSWTSGYLVPYAARSVQHLKQIGGFDAKSVMYGDFDSLPFYDRDRRTPGSSGMGPHLGYAEYIFKGHAVLSDYAYRNMPCAISFQMEVIPEVYVRSTKPLVKVTAGEPAFKTQKILGGRAIASDAFGRRMDYYAGQAQDTNMPGYGWYGHRDGYNVLYGDWHGKYFGDPNQSLIWWPPPALGTSSTWNQVYTALSSESTTMAWYVRIEDETDIDGGFAKMDESGHYVWHLLDVDAGIDVEN